MRQMKDFFFHKEDHSHDYENYRSMAYSVDIPTKGHTPTKQLEEKAKEVFEWAKKNGALFYTFMAFPQTGGIIEKQETFLDLNYYYKKSLENKGQASFSFTTLEKSETDGSSFPSGGLRYTHQARAYTIWDPRSEVFLRKRNKVLYIPSLLTSHTGEALDDKTLFRKAESVLETKTLELLQKMGVSSNAVVMALGLEQEFFVMSKEAYDKRIDIRSTGRALIGKMPPKHQQFADHYYSKLPAKVEDILTDIQKEFLEIGIPCKTRHKEVAPNQFELAPLFEEAGKTTDHNMILMEILKERFEDNGLVALFHEKPFANMNGSGKHHNWSLNYIDNAGKLVDLFSVPRDPKKIDLFRLMILIQLKAIKDHTKLYLSSVASCGNEKRLGGHEAPPRILSVFLGEAVSKIIDGGELDERHNLREDIPNMTYDLLQEDTDRNRTSPYAFVGNKFEYRAVGSSQNPSFPMAVIAATLAKVMDSVITDMNNGVSLEAILKKLTEETRIVRFDGNGYSPDWPIQAKKRGLYVNEKFYENIENFKTQGKVFVDIGACTEFQVVAKYETMKELYEKTVTAEKNCIQTVIGNQIIPRCYEHLRMVEGKSSSEQINRRSEQFIKAFDALIKAEYQLRETEVVDDLPKVAALREQIEDVCDLVNNVLKFIPKKESWPEFEDFMHMY